MEAVDAELGLQSWDVTSQGFCAFCSVGRAPLQLPHLLNEGPTSGPALFPDEGWTQEAVTDCQTDQLPGQRPMTLTMNDPAASIPTHTPAQGSSTPRLGSAWEADVCRDVWLGTSPGHHCPPRPDRKPDRSELSRHPLCGAWCGLQCFPC